MTRAATELCVTHSAVSQQIKQLEHLLGVALFIRQGRRLRVSENGRLYAMQVRDALASLTEATQLIRSGGETTELTVSLLPSFGCAWLIPRLASFRARYPHIVLRLQADLAIIDLRQEGSDIGIRMGKGNWADVETKLLFHDEQLIVASPEFACAKREWTPEEIVAAPAVLGMESWAPWCRLARVEAPPVTRGLRTNDSNLLLQAVRQGQGLALERRSLVQQGLECGELVQLSPLTVFYPYPYWLILPRGRRIEGKVTAFVDWLEDEVEQYLSCLRR
ncbi:LysR substrate-binding domain-containing protein [Salinicola endophyticus]|uniref:LysR substrate-binding domain-containing protein n=1 Tax=Salinicola endophyticus TaxID=1949083 RepID=A0AB74UF20_9GAMM